jgi:high-affinity Fe2+/Pb2+ permease
MAVTDYKQDEDKEVWPPAISLLPPARPRPAMSKEDRIGIAALITGAAGLICWVYAGGSLWTLYTANADNFWLDAPIHIAYYAGWAFAVAGVLLGILSKRTKAAKIGLALSICVLCLIVVMTFVEHNAHGNGQWIWNANYGDCGC